MGDPLWRPTASLEMLRARARLLEGIRSFFKRQGVLEVETPVCSGRAGTDPALESLRTRYTGPGAPAGLNLFLQTSPELAMKRLLAAGAGAIFQVCKAFRDGEYGAWHNPEFTIVEWYRPGFDHHQLMDEVAALVAWVVGRPYRVERIRYADAFLRTLDLDPHRAQVAELRKCACTHGLEGAEQLELAGPDPWLDLLFTRFIEPLLGREGLVFVYDFPVSKASLARIREGSPAVAERFELYLEGLELANGFHELASSAEQRGRFLRELEQRRLEGKPAVPLDERLLAALEHGLPDCAGVALGLDRLLMAMHGKKRIEQVLAFPLERA